MTMTTNRSIQSDVLKFWEDCICATMFLRGRCHQRPSIYFTESGSLVLDARPLNPGDAGIFFAIYVTCDQIAREYGFDLVETIEIDGLRVWKKGSGYVQNFCND